MNAKHSCKSSEWYTPASILNRCREVLGPIDLDPASDKFGNARVGAKRFIGEKENALKTFWQNSCDLSEKDITIFLNPPGGGLAADFWDQLMAVRLFGKFKHAMFICFSIEALQVTQRRELKEFKNIPSVCDFPMCIPARRMQFDKNNGTKPKSPTHANAIVYVPGSLDATPKFKNVFRDLGAILNVGRDI